MMKLHLVHLTKEIYKDVILKRSHAQKYIKLHEHKMSFRAGLNAGRITEFFKDMLWTYVKVSNITLAKTFFLDTDEMQVAFSFMHGLYNQIAYVRRLVDKEAEDGDYAFYQRADRRRQIASMLRQRRPGNNGSRANRENNENHATRKSHGKWSPHMHPQFDPLLNLTYEDWLVRKYKTMIKDPMFKNKSSSFAFEPIDDWTLKETFNLN
ncbi:uncharacterized protein LOC113234560 [Hyposmocoma kahamanoa]|uniref:uncharacterized protein LOC113234560 n=1 Tax=Hyposmocoma kahamanoa TaxID=1477025 RepID=UPI000E6D8347|nr:uncharacterized protein LOC113234560 [Hyposmocoma kahamanoa]